MAGLSMDSHIFWSMCCEESMLCEVLKRFSNMYTALFIKIVCRLFLLMYVRLLVWLLWTSQKKFCFTLNGGPCIQSLVQCQLFCILHVTHSNCTRYCFLTLTWGKKGGGIVALLKSVAAGCICTYVYANVTTVLWLEL